MPRLGYLLFFVLLASCGLKGDLYETPPPAAGQSAPADADADKGERKTIPATPDPALSR
jgi:predicted small lipoprotein YifL